MQPRNLFEGFHDVSKRSIKRYEHEIPIIQGDWEFRAMLELYNAQRPMRVLEVGSLFGGTLYHWITRAAVGAHVVSVDQLVPEGDERRDKQLAARERWSTWAAKAGVSLDALSGDSHDRGMVEKVEALGPFDFVFIDGDHSYDGVKQDFFNYGGLAAPGGVIALHDIVRAPWWSSIEVWRLWAEIKAAGHVTRELYSAPNQEFDPDKAGLGIGLVYV